MAAHREGFPAVSIGRSQGSELLTAHPLLSPSSPNHSSDAHSKQRSPSPSRNGPHYVPYTPRQRGPPTGLTTTGMTTHPSVAAPAPNQQGGATSKLQMVNLKAAAQNVGLDAGSVGWAILEKLVISEGGEWTEIWSALAVGKATLLLPLEPIAHNDKITTEFVKDHIILCDGPSRKNAHIVTLSGLRGTLDGNTLTLRSTLHPSSKVFLDLLSPVTRPSALANIAPLPHLPTATPYPEFGVPSYTSGLPLPPRIPPPLPPRPSISRGTQLSASPQSLPSRLPNPFASLFGSHGGKHPQQSLQTQQQASPPASLHEAIHPDQPLDVPAFTIARSIIRRDIAKSIDRALRAELHACCGSPPWVAERVDAFVAPWYPFSRVKSGGSEKGTLSFVVGDPLAGMLPDEIGEMVQGFYAKLEDDLRIGGGRRKASDTSHDGELHEKDQEEKESWIREVLASVERAICVLFFDRVFAPATSDDPSHDQALSSRVAALNMLDLNLEHLGVDVPPEANDGLENVVKACGQVLSGLELHQSPSEKASIMVQAHQEVINGLSRLPRVRLLTEEEERARASSKKPPTTNGGEQQPDIVVSPSQLSPSAEISAQLPITPPPSEPAVDTVNPSISEPPATIGTQPIPLDEHLPRPELVPLPPSYIEEPSASVEKQSPPPNIPIPTPVSSDVLLPLIIFAVVKSNPARLVSHLLYTQRFHVTPSGIAQGEEAFCLVNLMAVAEFLENVDLEALGLGNAGISAADLTPIPIARNSPKVPSISLAEEGAGVLRRQVDTIAGSAGRMLTGVTGVVDSSFGMLKQLLPGQTPPPVTPALDSTSAAAPWNLPHARPGFGLLRRETGFSIGGINIGGRSEEKKGEEELKEVSRPASLHAGEAGSDVGSEEESIEEDEEDGRYDGEAGSQYDARSIRSFESMMSRERRKNRAPRGSGRKSLTDRLAHVSGLAGLKSFRAHLPPRRESLLPNRFDTPVSSRPSSPAVHGGGLRISPPNQRFMDCSPDDLRLSEVAELLKEYRRLVDGIRAVGGFIGEE
ncbi:VPS9 domain-containing protein [Mycena indigotica]|uniref:VPS9 domain-containing protein n=1 Tax=Mycena indigotica TaxID=2126181 RepID=A0A8H6S4X4_9AGAR|nr:VPS9 domain-containing protein [Mycena indigotica]KAF7292828.1 VPS9 domain-containing protein [Mycena indigotica]